MTQLPEDDVPYIESLDECYKCHGAGDIMIRNVIRGCPCCREVDLYKPCRYCNGTGIDKESHANADPTQSPHPPVPHDQG